MNAASIEPSALIDALRVETAGYRALITVLEAERDALRAADPDALSALTAAKLDHVSALHGLASARLALLGQAGWPDMNTALAALAAAPDGTVVRREWSSLLVLAGTARGLNDVNGRLIANQSGISMPRCNRFCKRPACRPSTAPMAGRNGLRRCVLARRHRASFPRTQESSRKTSDADAPRLAASCFARAVARRYLRLQLRGVSFSCSQ